MPAQRQHQFHCFSFSQRHLNVFPRPFNINERSSEEEEWERKSFSEVSGVSLSVEMRDDNYLCHFYRCAGSEPSHWQPCAPSFAWDGSLPNYPGVRQPCSHCCILNKRRLLHRTEKQDCAIQCIDHLGRSPSPSQFSIYELFTRFPFKEAACGFSEKL